MRIAWQDYVGKTRRKGNRGTNKMTHQEAMKLASETWPKEKAKILRRRRRECKRQKSEPVPPVKKSSEPSRQNENNGSD